MKPRNISIFKSLIRHIMDLILFPYYGCKLLLKNCMNVSQKNPFQMDKIPSGTAVVAFTKLYDFSIIHKINRKLNISFNDLILSVISTSIKKFSCDKILFPKEEFSFDKLNCGIPVGVKDIPKCAEEVKLRNDIFCTVTSLKMIGNTLKEYQHINEEMNCTVKNSANIMAWKYMISFLNECVPAFAQKRLLENATKNVDLGISNLPGPEKEMNYNGFIVTDVYPMITVGMGRAFIIVGTYNGQMRLSVNLEKDLNIEPEDLIKYLDNEIEDLISKCDSIKQI